MPLRTSVFGLLFETMPPARPYLIAPRKSEPAANASPPHRPRFSGTDQRVRGVGFRRTGAVQAPASGNGGTVGGGRAPSPAAHVPPDSADRCTPGERVQGFRRANA